MLPPDGPSQDRGLRSWEVPAVADLLSVSLPSVARLLPYRAAACRAGAALAAVMVAVWPPSVAAASTGWQLAFRAHSGPSTVYNSLVSVSASGTASAWAVGGTDTSGGTPGAPLAERWNGTKWRATTLPSGLTGTLGAVSTPAPNDAWAVSQLTGYALHWNGTTW